MHNESLIQWIIRFIHLPFTESVFGLLNLLVMTDSFIYSSANQWIFDRDHDRNSLISHSVNQWMDWISESLDRNRNLFIFLIQWIIVWISHDWNTVTAFESFSYDADSLIFKSVNQWMDWIGSMNLLVMIKIRSFPVQWIRSVNLSVMTGIHFSQVQWLGEWIGSVNILIVIKNWWVNQLKRVI